MRSAVRTRPTLSTVSTQGCGIPSDSSSATSVGMPRRVRVVGTPRTWLRTLIAVFRVRIRCGRRPVSGCSYHQTSPRAMSTKDQPLVPPHRGGATSPRAPGQFGVRDLPSHRVGLVVRAGSPQRSLDQPNRPQSPRAARQSPCELAPTSTPLAWPLLDRAFGQGRQLVEPSSACAP
jgi:hypothetical protein